MEQPPSFVAQGESGLVCKLHCSLYGLKHSRPFHFFIIIPLLDSVFT